LETAPPKVTDRRAFSGATCQAEAIPPDVLAQILRDAIEARLIARRSSETAVTLAPVFRTVPPMNRSSAPGRFIPGHCCAGTSPA
jgi:hypothetical protein